MGEKVLETERLRLRRLEQEDAEFLVRLLNDESFVRHIGDRGVRTTDDVAGYLRNGPHAMYAAFGFGLWMVERREDGAPIGICGLLKRPALDDVDIGYALLPEYRGAGYALEAARGTLEYATATLGISRVVAIVSPGNETSIALLEKLGMRSEGLTRLSTDGDEVLLFGITCRPSAASAPPAR